MIDSDYGSGSAVSPVVAVVLLVAITVILSSVIATVVLDIGSSVSDSAEQTGTVATRLDQASSGSVSVTALSMGDTNATVLKSGTKVGNLTEAGDTITIPVNDSDTITVLVGDEVVQSYSENTVSSVAGGGSASTLTWDGSDWASSKSQYWMTESNGNLVQKDAPVVNKTLVEWYAFHSDSNNSKVDDLAPGGTPHDTSANKSYIGYRGLGGRAVYSPGTGGGGMSSSDQLDIEGSSKATVVIWAKPATFSNGDHWLITTYNGNWDNFLHLHMDDTSPQIRWGVEDNSNDHVTKSSASTGKWYMLTGLFDSGTQTLNINAGAYTASGSTAATSIPTDYGAPSYAVKGQMAGVRVYNTTLNSTQLQTLYKWGKTAPSYESKEKSFSEPKNVSLEVDSSLNGQRVNVTVTGSPGTASSENHTVTLSNGQNTYPLNFSSSHQTYDVSVTVYRNNPRKTAVINWVELREK